MFRGFIILLIFIGAIYLFMNKKKQEVIEKQKLEEIKKQEIKEIDPTLPEDIKSDYMLNFSKNTIETLKNLVSDTNENIRFSAIELLWQLKDKDIPKIIKKSFDNETESSVKIKIIDMLSKEKTKLSLHLIAYALKNYDKDTKVKACEVLGDFVDKETIDLLTPALKDYDEEVKSKAMDSIKKVRKLIEQHREHKLKEIFEPKPIFKVE
ncbi:MAG: HEAT repeat domain-containing protein [Elusimicrobiales bacterium]|nr:HEAT repeat domain-containing protein [Elusimicrobiales bacterium]